MKEQKGGFLGMLLSTLGASLLGNLSTSKGTIATSQGSATSMSGRVTVRSAEGKIRAV